MKYEIFKKKGVWCVRTEAGLKKFATEAEAKEFVKPPKVKKEEIPPVTENGQDFIE